MSTNLVAANATYHSAERVLALLASFEDEQARTQCDRDSRSAGRAQVNRLAIGRHPGADRVPGPFGRRYRLGVEIIRLGSLALRGDDIVARLQPAMDQLSGLTGETINLAVPAGPDILNVAEVPSSYFLNSSGGWIGRRTKPHAVANGKVLLAFGVIPMPATLERYTEHTICSVPALQAQLAEIRRDGYATAVAELEDGLVAVAAPVFSPDGACVAALSISGPAYRMPPGKLDELARLCAGAY